MEWRHALLAVAGVMAAAGIVLVTDAAMTLDMDFGGIGASLQMAFGGALLFAAVVFAAIGAWLSRAGRALRSPDPWWLACTATGSLALGLGWAASGSRVVAAVSLFVLVLAIAAVASGAVALQVTSRRGS